MPVHQRRRERETGKRVSYCCCWKEYMLRKRTEKRDRGFTGVRCSNSGCSSKLTGPLSLTLLLEIAIHGVVAVGPHGVGLETRTVLMERVTVSTSSTSIVQCFLQDRVASILTNAPSCSCNSLNTLANKDNECERRRKGLDFGEEMILWLVKVWTNEGIHGRTLLKNLR